jgi:maltodextrin utilization protein YvdJ
MTKTFKYKHLHYSVDVKFDDFKKAYPQITVEKFEELTGKKIEVKKIEKKEVQTINNDFVVDVVEKKSKKDVDKTQENIHDK